MPLDLTDDKSTLVQVMAWCRQATSHYLSQCWPRSMSPNGVTRPQWVNCSFLLQVWSPDEPLDQSCLHVYPASRSGRGSTQWLSVRCGWQWWHITSQHRWVFGEQENPPGPHFNAKTGLGISIMKIRWSWERLIFIMEIAELGKWHLYINSSDARDAIFWLIWF